MTLSGTRSAWTAGHRGDGCRRASPPRLMGMSDRHHIGSARNLRPHASSEAGQQVPDGARQQAAVLHHPPKRQPHPGQLLPGGCPCPLLPRRGPTSSRMACSGARTTSWTDASRAAALGPRRGTSASRPPPRDDARDERLAGRGPRTTSGDERLPATATGRRQGRAPRGPRPSDHVGGRAPPGRCRGTTPGRAPGGPRPFARGGPGQDAQHRPMSEVLQLGGTSPMSRSSSSAAQARAPRSELSSSSRL
jgi:hypothetical protein